MGWFFMGNVEFILLVLGSLFVIVDPIGLVPVFLAITPHDAPRDRSRMAALACTIAAAILILFAVAGKWLFRVLGISMPAIQMAASLLLLLIALDMLRARKSAVQQTSEETEAGVEKADIAITPLALPMLAGPGAISTVILLENQAAGLFQSAAVYAGIALVMLASFIILRLAGVVARWIGPIVMRVITRVMGLLLAAIAFQFLINALGEIGLIPK